MANIVATSLTAFELTDEEDKLGRILTQNQKQVIQNEVALCAEELLLMKLDGPDPTTFIHARAFTQGKMEAFKWLIDTAKSIEDEALQQSEVDIDNSAY